MQYLRFAWMKTNKRVLTQWQWRSQDFNEGEAIVTTQL